MLKMINASNNPYRKIQRAKMPKTLNKVIEIRAYASMMSNIKAIIMILYI